MELVQEAAMLHNEELQGKRQEYAAEDDGKVQEMIADYYSKPQNEIQFDYLYITPGAPEVGFMEWTRDSILSNYTYGTQKKIIWCIEEIRILEMMKADAQVANDTSLIAEFIDPLIRFNTSEKFGLENTSRNIDGFNAQTSRSQFNMIQQFRYSEDVERQQPKGIMAGFKMPRIGGGGGSPGRGSGMPGYGWDTV